MTFHINNSFFYEILKTHPKTHHNNYSFIMRNISFEGESHRVHQLVQGKKMSGYKILIHTTLLLHPNLLHWKTCLHTLHPFMSALLSLTGIKYCAWKILNIAFGHKELEI